MQPFPGASQAAHTRSPASSEDVPSPRTSAWKGNDSTPSAHFNPIALLKPQFHDIKHMNMIFGLILQSLNTTAEGSFDEQTLE